MGFFNVVAISILLYRCTTWTWTKRVEESLMGTTQECYVLFWTNPACNRPRISSCTVTYPPHHKNYPNKTNKTEPLTNSLMTFFFEPRHMDTIELADHLELTITVWILDVVWRTRREQWMIETVGEKESGKSLLSAWLNDDIYYHSSY